MIYREGTTGDLLNAIWPKRKRPYSLASLLSRLPLDIGGAILRKARSGEPERALCFLPLTEQRRLQHHFVVRAVRQFNIQAQFATGRLNVAF